MTTKTTTRAITAQGTRLAEAHQHAANWPMLLAMAGTLLLSSFFHFYALGRIEFSGEDEAQVMLKVARQFLWQDDWRNLGAILTGSHPPLRYLAATPFIGLFGPVEFWLRFPNALAGVLVCYWVFRLGRRIAAPNTTSTNAERIGLIAAFLISVSAMSGVYRSANGIGIFTLWLLIGFEQFLIALDAKNAAEEKRHLIYTALALALAAVTFIEGAIFAVTAAGLYLIQKRRIERTVIPAILTYSVILAGYVAGWVVLPLVLAAQGYFPGGNADHLGQRLGGIGSLNLADFVVRMLSLNSIWLCLLLLLGMVAGAAHLRQRGWLLVFYFLPHWVIWMFVMKLPNGHEVYAVPMFAIWAAIGLHRLYDTLPAKWQRTAAIGALFLLCTLAGWHNYVAFLQGRLAPTAANGVFFFQDAGLAAGAPRFVHWGQAAAGVYIREHAAPDEMILSNFGGSLELYYAGRIPNPYPLSEMRSQLADTAAMRERNIRYLVLREQTLEQFEPGLSGTPAAVVMVEGNPLLWIYDLWNLAPTQTAHLDAAELRPRFYQEYANFRMLREFQLP